MGLLISLDKGDYVILATDKNGHKQRWAVDTLAETHAITDPLERIGGYRIELFGPDGLRFWAVGG
jgi:hypothetical protein